MEIIDSTNPSLDLVIENNAISDDLAFWGPLLQSVWAGAATGLGALFVVFQDKVPDPSVLSFSLAMAAGVMLVVSVLDMYIPLCARDGLIWPTLTLGAGYLLFYFGSRLLPEPEFMALPTTSAEARKRDDEMNKTGNFGHALVSSSVSPRRHKTGNISGSGVGNGQSSDHLFYGPSVLDAERQRSMRLGTIMFLSLTAHNFPEGLAVSVSSLQSESLGFLVTVAIALHNIPEGLAIATPIYAATGSRKMAIGMALLSGATEPLGALMALLFLRPIFEARPWLVGYVMCFVGGIMTAVAVVELIPEAQRYRRDRAFNTGFFSGAVVMLITMQFV